MKVAYILHLLIYHQPWVFTCILIFTEFPIPLLLHHFFSHWFSCFHLSLFHSLFSKGYNLAVQARSSEITLNFILSWLNDHYFCYFVSHSWSVCFLTPPSSQSSFKLPTGPNYNANPISILLTNHGGFQEPLPWACPANPPPALPTSIPLFSSMWCSG